MPEEAQVPESLGWTKSGICEEIFLPSWKCFVDRVKEFSAQWIFRGQLLAEWTVCTSIARRKELNGWFWDSVETGCLLNYFQQSTPEKFKKYFKPQTNLEWLSLIQHYGGVTGLLDWTTCPYVALFFAFNDGISCSEITREKIKIPDDKFDSLFNEIKAKELIYQENRFICRDNFAEVVRDTFPETNERQELLGLEYSAVWAVNQAWLKKKAYEKIKNKAVFANFTQDDLIEPENFDKIFFDTNWPEQCFVLPVCPDLSKSNFNNKRLKRQKGIFLRESDTIYVFETNLAFEGECNYPHSKECKENIKKFVIPKRESSRREVLKMLKQQKKIDKAFLLPGKDIFRPECRKILQSFNPTNCAREEREKR